MQFTNWQQAIGFGFFVVKSPSVSDPAAVSKYVVSLHVWHYTFRWYVGTN